MTPSDMHISGSGTLPAGEYRNVSISGSGKGTGEIHCESLSSSGSSHFYSSVTCSGAIRISGASHFEENVQTGTAVVSGSCHFEKDLIAEEAIGISGACKIGGACRTRGKLELSGSISVQDSLEAEYARIRGRISCAGLLNAEELIIQRHELGYPSEIANIGGSRIQVCIVEPFSMRIGFFRRFQKNSGRLSYILIVKDSIEGDEIELEYTKAHTVTGKTVRIGDGCTIDVVRYTESADISPNATVQTLEKIE